jgi:hypothetical protein
VGRAYRFARTALGALAFAVLHGSCLVAFDDYPVGDPGGGGVDGGGVSPDAATGGTGATGGVGGVAGAAAVAGCAGGQLESVVTFGAASTEYLNALGADSTGPVLGGHHEGAFDVASDAVPHSGGTGPDAFAVKLFADGTPRWAIGHGSVVAGEFVMDVATDAAGRVFVVGGYSAGAAHLGKGPLTFVGDMEVFVAKYEAADGAAVWTHGFAAGHQIAQAVVADPSGNALVAINASAPIDVGTGQLPAQNKDMIIAKYDTTGAGDAVWTRVFGDAQDQTVMDIATDASGAIYFAGRYQGSLDALYLPDSAGDDDLFVVKLDAGGDVEWSTPLGAPQKQQADALALGNDGVFVVGAFAGSLPALNPPLTASGVTLDALVVKVGLSGAILWAKAFGGAAGEDVATGVVALPDGGAVVLGHFWGTVDFGGAPLESAGDEDLFVVRLDGSGNVVWRQRIGNAAQDRYAELAWGNWGGGHVLVGLSLQGTLDLGSGPVSSKGAAPDLLLASLCP